MDQQARLNSASASRDTDWWGRDYDSSYGSFPGSGEAGSSDAAIHDYWRRYAAEREREKLRQLERVKVLLKEGLRPFFKLGPVEEASAMYNMYYFAENDIVSSFIHTHEAWESGESEVMVQKMAALASISGLPREALYLVDVGANVGAVGANYGNNKTRGTHRPHCHSRPPPPPSPHPSHSRGPSRTSLPRSTSAPSLTPIHHPHPGSILQIGAHTLVLAAFGFSVIAFEP